MSTESSSPLLEAISEIVGAIGTAGFPKSLDALVAAQVSYDCTAVVAFPQSQHPILLHDGFGEFRSEVALKNYLQGTYLLDPVYQACQKDPNPGLYRMSELEKVGFFDNEYVSSREIHPCISMNPGGLAEEVIYLSPPMDGVWITYSVMRSKNNSPFSGVEFRRLKEIEKIVCNGIQRNWAGFITATHEDGSVVWSRRGAGLEEGFETFASYILSPRERMIMRLLLEAHTAAAISKKLRIAEGTVKNHKKSIYHKLNISSQAELFTLFIEYVCSQYETGRRSDARPSDAQNEPQLQPPVVRARDYHSLISTAD